VQPGSVVVTLEAASWADLEAANAKLSEGLELPSFGTLEKEKEAEEEKVGNTHGPWLVFGIWNLWNQRFLEI